MLSNLFSKKERRLEVEITMDDFAASRNGSTQHDGLLATAIKRTFNVNSGDFIVTSHKVIAYRKNKWWQKFRKNFINYRIEEVSHSRLKEVRKNNLAFKPFSVFLIQE